MPAFEDTLTTVFVLLTIVALVPLGIALTRLAQPRIRVTDATVPRGLRALKAVSAVAVLLLVLAAIFAVTVLIPLAPLAAPWARVAFYAVLGGWAVAECLLAASVPAAHAAGSPWRTALLAGGTAAALLAAVYLLRDAPGALSYPPAGESVAVHLPFEGTWIAVHAGASGATNHHARLASQRFAADLARLGPDGRLRRGETDTLDDFYTFGAPLTAPAEGTVVASIDGLPDDQRPEFYEDIAGNHVVIQVGAEAYVIVGHMQQGSVAVIAGEQVQVGDPIGRAGNSGNSDFPHVHLHVQDRPDITPEARALPYHVVDFRRKRWLVWRNVGTSGLLRNDLLRPQE